MNEPPQVPMEFIQENKNELFILLYGGNKLKISDGSGLYCWNKSCRDCVLQDMRIEAYTAFYLDNNGCKRIAEVFLSNIPEEEHRAYIMNAYI